MDVVTRRLKIEAADQDEDARTIVATIATVTPVSRGSYVEILSCEPSAVDLVRAPLPLIEGHDTSRVNIGLIEDPVADGRRVRGRLRFGQSERASELWRDVKAGIVRYLSVQYEILATQPAGDQITVTRWRPLEVSLVSVPADHNAQIGRSFTMPPDPNAADQAGRSNPEAARAERERCTEISAIGQHFQMPEAAQRAIESGSSVEAFKAEVMTQLQTRSPRRATERNLGVMDPHLDLSPRDIQRYSITRALRSAAENRWQDAPFELECARELERRFGPSKRQNAFRVPLDVLAFDPRGSTGRRDLSTQTAGAGGHLVGTDHLSGSFIDQLRNRAIVFLMGATRLPGLKGDVSIPKQVGAATHYWVTEGQALTESDQVFGQLALTPKTVGAYTEITRQLLIQSAPSVDMLVMDDLARVVALGVDSAAIAGSGSSGQPTGVINTSGVGSVTGTSIDYAKVLEFQTDVLTGNAMLNPGATGYIAPAAVASLLAQRQRFASTDSPLWTGNLLDGQIAGFKAKSSAQVPSASMIFGDWSAVVIGEWGILEIDVNPYADFKAGTIAVRAFYSVDIGVRHAGSFSVASSIT